MLVKYLHKKHTASNLAWEGVRKTRGVVKYDPNHEIPVTWGRAYKESVSGLCAWNMKNLQLIISTITLYHAA